MRPLGLVDRRWGATVERSTSARGENAARETRTWGTSLSGSDREPATGPACGRGVPPITPCKVAQIHLDAAGYSGTGLAWATVDAAAGP